MQRTLANETTGQIGSEVTVSGWVNSRRDHGGVIFIDLRDHTGLLQLTIHPENKEAFEAADKCRDEFVLRAVGKIVERAPELVNKNIPTGGLELVVSVLTILNTSKVLPFQVAHGHGEENLANEDLRLKYRFLDLRR
jgi:aspartyl-tRNA synthetase